MPQACYERKVEFFGTRNARALRFGFFLFGTKVAILLIAERYTTDPSNTWNACLRIAATTVFYA